MIEAIILGVILMGPLLFWIIPQARKDAADAAHERAVAASRPKKFPERNEHGVASVLLPALVVILFLFTL